jgi:hypothetical protein
VGVGGSSLCCLLLLPLDIGVRLGARSRRAYTNIYLYIKIKISCQYDDIFLTFYKSNFYKYNTIYKFDVGAPIFHTNNFIVEYFVVIKTDNNIENLRTIIKHKIRKLYR